MNIVRDRQGCSCSDKCPEMTSQICGNGMPLPYWCETCQSLVPEKRCPVCRLKARKVRLPDQGGVKI